MASLRKIPRLRRERKNWLTIDRTLLAGVVGLVGFGVLQTGAVNVAANDKAPPASVMTASRQAADYTPVGSIDKAPETKAAADKADSDKRLSAPFGLRSSH